MKNYLHFLAFLSIVFFCTSCSSDRFMGDGDGVESRMQIISYDIKNTEFTPLKSTNNEEYAIYYIVHDKITGNLVKTKYLSKDIVTSIQDTLPYGDYYVSLLATTSDEPNYIVYGHLFASSPYWDVNVDINGGSDDLFYHTSEITVSEESSSYEMTLSRIVGKIEINIEDAHLLPADMNHVFIILRNDLPEYFRLEDQLSMCTSINVNFEDGGLPALYATREEFTKSEGYKFTLYLISNTPEYRYDGKTQGVNILVQTMEKYYMPGKTQRFNVKKDLFIEKNTTIKLTGKLFEKDLGISNIVIDTEWSEEVIEDTFD